MIKRNRFEAILTYGLSAALGLGGSARLKVVERKGFSYRGGDEGKPLLVCHADNVWGGNSWKSKWKRNLHNYTSRVKDKGIAADDRCGLAVLDALAREDFATLILDGEERGCIGARAATNNHGLMNKLAKHPFMVEVDRRGHREIAFYDNRGEQLADELAGKVGGGWTPHHGSVTDITHLSPAAGIPGVNISAGFFNEHTQKELASYEITCQAERFIKEVEDYKPQPFKPKPEQEWQNAGKDWWEMRLMRLNTPPTERTPGTNRKHSSYNLTDY